MEVLHVIIPTVLTTGLFFILYLLNEQVVALNRIIAEVQNKVSDLRDENLLLRKELLEQKKLLEHSEMSSNVLMQNSQIDPALITANNEMIQFYIKTTGVVVASLVILLLAYSFFPRIPGFKDLVPDSLYSYIQDKTPFFQETSRYTYREPFSHSNWQMEVINKKYMNIQVKPDGFGEYISVSNFIENIPEYVSAFDYHMADIQVPTDVTVQAAHGALQHVSTAEAITNAVSFMN